MQQAACAFFKFLAPGLELAAVRLDDFQGQQHIADGGAPGQQRRRLEGHAAAEVDRLIKAVREDRMPMDEFRLSYALSEDNKKWLLESALAFKASLTAARQWEDQAAKKTVQSAINPTKVIK